MRIQAYAIELSLLLLSTTMSNAAPFQSAGLITTRSSIEGRVTLAGEPTPGVTVTLAPRTTASTEPVATSVTDEVGHFKFGDLEPGDYLVDAFAPALVAVGANASNSTRGRSVTVRESETVTGMDIALTRGGVITGRVVDSNRQPIIDITVDLRHVDQSGRGFPRRVTASDQFMYRTDDIGTFRVYGLPAGRYKVSVGVPLAAGAIRYEGGYYPRTFYGDAKDEAEARIVELSEGGEVGNIDITVGQFAKSYSVSGHIVDSDTSKPMAGLVYGYGAVSDSGQYIGSVASISARSTPTGEFYIEGLPPGRYAAFVINEGDSPVYCEPTVFEIADSDLEGIEVKTTTGASISGIIAFDDDARIESTGNLIIDVRITLPVLEALRRETVRITPDGRFSAVGLRPGKAVVTVRGSIGGKGVMVSRMEHKGVPQQFIELRAGETVTGVRLVLSRQPESR